jgi:formiminotetrahydrofolate cyclodeaminase
MELSLIINAILGIVILIAFFRMSSNLSAIKDELKGFKAASNRNIRREHNLNYQLNRVIGEKEAAYKNLMFILMYDLTSETFTPQRLREQYDYFKLKNEVKFTELGYPFPEFPFNV